MKSKQPSAHNQQAITTTTTLSFSLSIMLPIAGTYSLKYHPSLKLQSKQTSMPGLTATTNNDDNIARK
jgi:hypothetical protein